LKQKPVDNKLISHPTNGQARKEFDQTWPKFKKMLGTLDLDLQPMVSIHLAT
jgi:hypothetical protein